MNRMAGTPALTLSFGQIFRTKLYFDKTDTWRNKYLVIVGDDKKSSKILFFVTSSRAEKFPQVPIVTQNIIEIKSGEMTCFTANITVIDCRTVYAESYQWFIDKIRGKKISIHGELLKIHQDKIKQIAFQSRLISQKHAQIIFNY